MASALATDPINQLEENLQCAVCLEVLTDPRTLPCCHSFCKNCLERTVETCRGKAPRGQSIREFPCPNCHATFILDPDKRVADMPQNHFICNMVKAAAVLDRGTRVPCSHNCGQSYSVARCVTCEKFLCRECLTGHNNYRGHNGHSVLTMEELLKPENCKKINDKMYCNEHSGMELKVYCETCDQLICRDCMDFKHAKQGHSCVLVKDEANKYKELLASSNKTTEDTLTEGNALLQQLTLTTEHFDLNAENIRIQIAQKKDMLLKTVTETLEQKTKTILKKVDDIHKAQRTKMETQAEETKLYVKNIKTSLQLSKKLIDQGSEEEIISSQKMMLDNAKKLLTDPKKYFKAVIPVVKLSYISSNGKEPLNEEILKGLVNSLGEVYKEERNTGGCRYDDDDKPFFLSYAVPAAWKNFNTCPDSKLAIDGKKSKDDECSICLSEFTKKKTLDKCGHSFCTKCINKAFKVKKQCPLCFMVYGPSTGCQPKGNMFNSYQSTSLSGFSSCGSIVISYRFPSGTQGPDHPNPGKPYQGTSRTAYLPDNREGRKVLKLLEKAFNQKLTFTIGRSTTTGMDDCVTWNDIHHKTSMRGGPTNFGYPDPDYLKRVQDELAAKGITE